MNKELSFLKEYLKNNRETGSIVPDSAALVDALLEHAPFRSARVILEYGPASGAVTRQIIGRKAARTSLVCVEKNRRFYEELVNKVSGKDVFIVNDDALRWARHSAGSCGIRSGEVDCIISTLPCSSIDFEALLRASVLPLLRKGGVFIQYMHTVSFFKGFRLRPVLEKHFAAVSSRLVLANVPPTLVYTSRGAL